MALRPAKGEGGGRSRRSEVKSRSDLSEKHLALVWFKKKTKKNIHRLLGTLRECDSSGVARAKPPSKIFKKKPGKKNSVKKKLGKDPSWASLCAVVLKVGAGKSAVYGATHLLKVCPGKPA